MLAVNNCQPVGHPTLWVCATSNTWPWPQRFTVHRQVAPDANVICR